MSLQADAAVESAVRGDGARLRRHRPPGVDGRKVRDGSWINWMIKDISIIDVHTCRIKEDMDRVDRQLVEVESTIEGSGVLKNFVPLIFVSANLSLPDR